MNTNDKMKQTEIDKIALEPQLSDAHGYNINAALTDEGWYKIELTESVILLAVRNDITYSWCGYVGIPLGHPWYKIPVDELHLGIQVHNGISFADFEPAGFTDTPHKWWFIGFEAMSGSDWHRINSTGIYRDLPYIWKEIIKMQIAADEATAEQLLGR